MEPPLKGHIDETGFLTQQDFSNMPDKQRETYSRQYAQFVAKEVVKASAAQIFDDLRHTLSAHFTQNPGQKSGDQAQKVMELLSDVECRYYNEFQLQDVFDEVLEL